jgi:hypothetical protein
MMLPQLQKKKEKKVTLTLKRRISGVNNIKKKTIDNNNSWKN